MTTYTVASAIRLLVHVAPLALALSSTGCLVETGATSEEEDVAVNDDALTVKKTVDAKGGGSGVYKTVQAAIDSVPNNNTTPVLIRIKNGVYKERITVPQNKPFITLRGWNTLTSQTVLTFDVHPDQNKGIGTSQTATAYFYANDFRAEYITIENSSGQTAGQSVAVFATGDRQVFSHVRLLGWQDTLYAGGGRQYYKDSYIEGDVDFIFGNATAVFEQCTIHSKGYGYLTAQSRTAANESNGYVFLNSTITGSGANTIYLGRPWRPYSRVVHINTTMDNSVRPVGWDNWGNTANQQTTFYAESGSKGPGANPNARAPWSRKLTNAQANQFLPGAFFGGWQP